MTLLDPSEASSSEASAAYAATLPELLALPAAEVVAVNADVQTVITIVYGAIPRVRALRGQIRAALPTIPRAALDDLRRYALALAYAEAACATATAPPGDLPVVYAEALARRDRLLADVRALVARGLLAKAAIAGVSKRHGYKHVGPDLLTLIHAIRGAWEGVRGATPITEAELADLEALHLRLLELSSRRGERQSAVKAAKDLRRRAFTVVFRAYELVRKAVGFLLGERERERVAPRLYAGRPRRRKVDRARAASASHA